MNLKRSSGLLLHISSLGGKHGIGSLGNEAYEFADFLTSTRTRYWQILPIHPVLKQFGYSPYASTSTYAGNPLLINPFSLSETYSCLPECRLQKKISTTVPFDEVVTELHAYFHEVYTSFFAYAPQSDKARFTEFCHNHEHWLNDYTLFTACSLKFGTNNWSAWDRQIAYREPDAVAHYRQLLEDDIRYHSLLQFFFFEQWHALKKYCNERHIELIGDVPIYVGYDSADVWASPDVFFLDEERKADPVAGVPPDYFSDTGQRWGNPLYRWYDSSGQLNNHTVTWWTQRLQHQLLLVDCIRIDHFRAFESYWTIPRHEETAVHGTWEDGPGHAFFTRIQENLGDLPLIAEDLGIITEGVRKLRRELGLPGMKILQFAFDHNNDNAYLPHSVDETNCIMYTGTHDNDTTNGWYFDHDMDESMQTYIRYYLNIESDTHFHQKFIKSAMMTPAKVCIIPVQDLLGLGTQHRMNTPGTMQKKNWGWRLESMRPVWAEKEFWKDLNHLYNRAVPKASPKDAENGTDQNLEKSHGAHL